MGDEASHSDFVAVSAAIGGRQRRLESIRKLRAAIARRDIVRSTPIRVENHSGQIADMSASELPELANIFDELHGSADFNPSVSGMETDGTTVFLRDEEIAADETGSPEPLPAAITAPTTNEGGSDRSQRGIVAPSEQTLSEVDPPIDRAAKSGNSAVIVAILAFVLVVFLIFKAMPRPDRSLAPDAGASSATMPTEVAVSMQSPRPSESPAEAEPEAKADTRKSERAPPKPVASQVVPPPIVATASPEPVVSQARPPAPRDQSRWSRRISENYPPRASEQNIQGRVGVRVTVAGDGKVIACVVTSSSGSAVLDTAACSGLKRFGQFFPALDEAGSPTDGYFSTAIIYKLDSD